MKLIPLLAISMLGAISAPSMLPAQEQSTTAKPASASDLLKTAQAEAKKSKKNVFVVFHASWCGWCKKLDAVLEKPEVKKTFSASYVLVHLDVMENGEKKSLENAGAEDLMKSWGGEKSGLPFYVILNPKGDKLADSNAMPKNENIGYPGSKEEIAAFAEILKTTAPKMKEAQRKSIVGILEKSAPAPTPSH